MELDIFKEKSLQLIADWPTRLLRIGSQQAGRPAGEQHLPIRSSYICSVREIIALTFRHICADRAAGLSDLLSMMLLSSSWSVRERLIRS